MHILTILLFFLYTWGLGFSVTKFIKNSENFLERNLMRIGIGLGVFIVLGILLNFLHVPLDWKIFLLLSLIIPLYSLIISIKNNSINLPKINLTKSNIYILIVIILFSVCLYMYAGGSFEYPYLEDDDPYAHAMGVKYIAEQKTAYASGLDFQYVDPYPPGYDLLMAMLHQTSNAMMWTLKLFNGLIISLGIVFFYFFAKSFTGDKNKALFSTFVLAAIPSFLTHFIWAHSLVIILFFPAMYCLEKISLDKLWKYPAMILIASILLTQPDQALKSAIMFGIYWLIKIIYQKQFLKDILIAGIGGFAISLIWWFNRLLELLSAVRADSIARFAGSDSSLTSTTFFGKIIALFPPGRGTATQAYSFNDFFIVQPFGGINVQIGWGMAISLLVAISIIYILIKYKELLKQENAWISITLFWFIFTFLGTNSVTFNLPIGLFAFRFWLILAIPVALLSSIGLSALCDLSKRINMPKIIILAIIITGVFATAGYQKFTHNTLSGWPPGGRWTSQEELEGYLWLKTLPPNTRIFDISTAGEKAVVAFDMYSCAWCKETKELRDNFSNLSVKDFHSWLKKNNYEYVVISGMTYKYLNDQIGENRTIEIFSNFPDNMGSSGSFSPYHQTKGMVLFKVL